MLDKIKRLFKYTRRLLHFEEVIINNSNKTHSYQFYLFKRDQMMQYAVNCKSMGVSSEKILPSELIVSLTSFGNRLKYAALAIESIMQGTMKPNKIVLAISDDLKNKKLPLLLQNQQKRGLEILYCKDIRSYTKLIPTLRIYPEAYIITIDDDCIYNQDLVENLVNTSIDYPHDICANRVHRIRFDKKGNIETYLKWGYQSNIEDASYLNFLTGVGGVLYPPHCLSEKVTDETTFLNICKSADDIWFYAMAVIKGTLIRKTHTYNQYGNDYVWNVENNDGLNNVNIDQNANDVQFKAVARKYNLMPIIYNAWTSSVNS